jgi:hypothetical protein
MGFRPYLSDAAPQSSPVQAWHMGNMADVTPAQRAMSFLGMPNDSIISGRYGKTEVSAIGSAKRHIADDEVSRFIQVSNVVRQYRVL